MGLVTLASHITLQRRLRRYWREALSMRSGLRNSKIAADFSSQEAVDLGMARDSRPAISGRVAPPGMGAALADQDTAVRREVADQLAALHTVSVASSKPFPA